MSADFILMDNGDHGGCVFPLTCLQIGDLRSYLSHLSIFLAFESDKFYILVDNRPWLDGLVSRSAHLWQLMVTKVIWFTVSCFIFVRNSYSDAKEKKKKSKFYSCAQSRLSPFANTRSQRGKKEIQESQPKVCTSDGGTESKSKDKWFSLIDAAMLSETQALLPMKKIKHSLQFNDDLQQTLFGLIIFEVSWNNVRGINYFNELQTDTSMAIETKHMKRWEFDSITQAAGCMDSWFSGTLHEQNELRNYLLSTVDEVFYDAEEESLKGFADDNEIICSYGIYSENESHPEGKSNSIYPSLANMSPSNVPYKRRKVAMISVDKTEAKTSQRDGDSFEHLENNIEASYNKDIMVLFRFNDAYLPFRFKDIIMSDLRLLTLLEAGLPSWAIFLQSYPLLCNIYRPWMCPLARALYILISFITLLIGFYDLYKNVPLLKATFSHLFGPFFNWIENWEMLSRIKYLGTMLFLHNCQKAAKFLLTTTRTIKSCFSVLAQPVMGPLLEVFGLLSPLWNLAFEAAESLFSIVCIIADSCWDLVEMLFSPVWLLISVIWRAATTVLLPTFWMVSKLIYAPIRLILALANSFAYFAALIYKVILDVLIFIKGVSRVASVTEVTVSTCEPSIWRSLWKDLFSKVFRAFRSVLNGLVAFFVTCNRHRLSIYNHFKGFNRRLSGRHTRSLDNFPRHRGRSRSVDGRRRSCDVTNLRNADIWLKDLRSSK